ncbi:hypothetical protein CYMTET_53368 [Cymbomonas tetramitiformis]|uniref:Kinesin light chain n=1 Tax=Cymbomonas tetramitiformis TaxID=36881 RepID=A0AAE0EQ42_9CHLO|nr:hypothetical protein CYMTET_53368 [Cymbomonas tetramitiformis]
MRLLVSRNVSQNGHKTALRFAKPDMCHWQPSEWPACSAPCVHEFATRTAFLAALASLPAGNSIAESAPKAPISSPQLRRARTLPEVLEEGTRSVGSGGIEAARHHWNKLRVGTKGGPPGQENPAFSKRPVWNPNEFPLEGVSLSSLKQFLREHEGQLTGRTTDEVCRGILLPATAATLSSYTELLKSRGEPVAKATVFVSHAWRYPFCDLLDVVLSLEKTELKPEEVWVWLDVFCVNQHVVAERTFSWWSTTFREAVRDIGRTLVVLAPFDNPTPLTRAWCLFEIFSTVDTGAELELRLSSDEELAFAKALRAGEFDFNQWVSKVNLERAEAYNPADREQILQVVESSVGITALNTKVLAVLTQWLTVQARGLQTTQLQRSKSRRLSSGTTLLELGKLYQQQGDFPKAVDMYRAALEHLCSQHGQAHPGTLAVMLRLADLLKEQSKLDEAEALCRKAMQAYEDLEGAAVGGGDHAQGMLECVNQLAIVLKKQGKLSEAEPLYRQALAGMIVMHGREDILTIKFIQDLAHLLKKQGKLDEARELYRETLEGRRALLGDEHPDTLSTLSTLSNLLKDQGDFEQAELLYYAALEGRRAKLGDRHPSTLRSLNHLAELFLRQGRLSEAGELFLEAMEGRKEVLGGNHPLALQSMHNYAVLLCEQGHLQRAELLILEALEGRRSEFGTAHVDTLASIHDLAILRKRQGKADEAEALCRQALMGRQSLLGEDHPDTLASTNELSLMLMDVGALEAAETLVLESLAGRKKLFSKHHPDVLTSIHSLARLRSRQGRNVEAEAAYWEALEGRRMKLGESHPYTLTTRAELDAVMTRQRSERSNDSAQVTSKARVGIGYLILVSIISIVAKFILDRGR